MQFHGKARVVAGVASLIGAVGMGAAFVPAASAQVTAPSNTITNFGGNGSTFTVVGFNGGTSNLEAVQPGSSNTITETLTMPDLGNGNIYTAPIGFVGAAAPFSSCPYGFGSGGSTDTTVSSFTAPNTAGIYNITAFLGPNFTCADSWHTSAGQTVATLVVTSFSSVCSLAQSYSTDPAVASGLCDKLSAAAASSSRGNTTATTNQLRAFDNQVAAQTGKALTSAQAETLTTLVYYLMPTS